MTTREKAGDKPLLESRSFWASEVWQGAREKHERYLTEAAVARSLENRCWRAVLAASLRQFADQLETPRVLDLTELPEDSISSGLGMAQRRNL
jgi:hypothetical protein